MWTFQESRHLLVAGEEERRLEPKSAAVLAKLIAAEGRVVTKEELLEAAWADRFVTEEVLTNAVYQIRKALDDDARDPRYIETIPKRGYRLVAPIAVGEPARPEPASRPGRHRWLAAVLGGLVLGVVGGTLADRPAEEPFPRAATLVSRGWNALDASAADGAGDAAVLAREALALAPTHPDAWALLATARAGLAASGDPGRAAAGYANALEAADRALALSPGHPRALAARARARWLGAWDWDGAEADLRAALLRDPDSPALWVDLAELQFFAGRADEARESVDRALARAPGLVRARMTAGMIATFAGEPGEATRQYRAVLARHPEHVAASRQLAKLGNEVAARSTDERLAALTTKERVRPGHLAVWHLESGDTESALDWLERAVDQRDATVLFFRYDPRWEPLRDHPRYRDAMAEIYSGLSRPA